MNKKPLNNKKNIKTKIISVAAAVALWMYVIAVVDPEDRKVIEDIPITIKNTQQIEKEGYVIYPKDYMTTDITLEGKLSEIQKITKNSVSIYGEVINPVEGKNTVSLSSNISSHVSREIKESSFVVNLEKKITKKVPVKIEIPSNYKEKIHSANGEYKYVKVSGPRSLVDEVSYVSATINTDKLEKMSDKTQVVQEIYLLAFTKNKKPVSVDIEIKKMDVEIKFAIEKEVEVVPNLGNWDITRDSLSISPEKVTIIGDNETLKNIEEISTNRLNEEDFSNASSKKVKLVIPDDIKIKGDIEEVQISKK
ncbi:CdaR family protein [Peptostreptococcus sp.]|uniref:CdaR family protein n=1 Tax=Peptostreptococcus sp. TaxID=1262 RepID=UPI00290E0725|nr:hypothetical protein [Peptostreptococcus sp.]MDU3423353.1 hypothetical protein [Peptostreptococcus anaerobius]MDU3430193.1 hypothetical protein [Peptostreptococcus sp.]MDU3456062.1 hypothetical protein [Peptostreptococcus sp.]